MSLFPTIEKPLCNIPSTDNLRKSLTYVQFKDGYAVATDAHVLVKIHLSLYGFDDASISQLPEEFYMSAESMKLLYKYRNKTQIWSSDKVVTLDGSGNDLFTVDYITKPDFKFPEYEKIIEEEREPTNEVRFGMNPMLLKRVIDAMVSGYNGHNHYNFFSIELDSPTKPIFVRRIGDEKNLQLGVVMPLMIDF